MKWFKKWSFLILIVAAGAVWMTVADGSRIYAEPLAGLRNRLENIGVLIRGAGQDEAGAPSGIHGEGQTGADGSAAGSSTGMNGEGQTGADGNAAGSSTGMNGEGQTGADGNAAGSSSDMNGEGQGGADGNAAGNSTGMNGEGQTGADGNAAGSSCDVNGEGQGGADGNAAGSFCDVNGEGQGGAVGSDTDGTESGAPPYCTVEDDYFSDAVFIGDSRTVGMYEYGGLEETAAFYASTGLTVYKLFTAEIVAVPGQKKKITIEEALQNTSFSKIYLMLGINEMGTGTVETFTKKYSEAVRHLRELQPDAIIYIQGIMKVTTERSEQGDYINNEGIEARNAELEKLADNQRIFYLDVNPLICDETGGMIPDYTFDGVHLKARYVEIWKDFLKEHAIKPVQ